MEVQVLREPTLREVCERLGGALPDGFSVVGADALYPGEKWRVVSIRYEVRGDALPVADEVAGLLARERIPAERRGKEVDLRPLLRAATREDDRLVLDIAWTDSGTARPEDVLRALGRDPEGFRAVKTGMTFVSSLGETIVRENDEKHPHQ
jgi:hypothetical protein